MGQRPRKLRGSKASNHGQMSTFFRRGGGGAEIDKLRCQIFRSVAGGGGRGCLLLSFAPSISQLWKVTKSLC